MRLSNEGFPCIILSHRRREFLETCVNSLRQHAIGITDVIVVDDSGDDAHREWLLSQNYEFTASDRLRGHSLGYLGAMRTVWETAQSTGYDHVLLWEEDFFLTRALDVDDMACVMEANTSLAQLNLQRQAVYKVERRLGYIESHARRGYGVVRRNTEDIAWIRRLRPFTTNPGLLRAEVLNTPWPSRREADAVDGGAEPAMSRRLERQGYNFGWLGVPNKPYVHHAGTEMKTGKGY